MEKKTLLALILALAVMMFYSRAVSKRYPKTIAAPTKPYQEPYHQQPRTVSLPTSETSRTLAQPQSENLTKVTTDVYEIILSDIGGVAKEMRLLEYSKANGDGQILLYKAEKPEEGIFSLELGSLSGGNLATARFKTRGIEQVSPDEQAIEYSYADKNGLEILKRLTFRNSNYDIGLELTIMNRSNVILDGAYDIVSGSRIDKLGRKNGRFVEAGFLVNDKLSKTNPSKIHKKGGQGFFGQTKWSILRNKYFSLMLYPHDGSAGAEARPISDKNIVLSLKSAPLKILPGSAITHKFLFYAGPNDLDRLSSYGLGLEKAISFGPFGSISRFLLSTLKFFHSKVHNYGVAIILLTIAVSIVMYPLTAKSLRSMKEMQQIQPELDKLRKELKDNPQKLNKEMLELYRKHKVNPMGGCFPILLQMPIFISLYQALIRSIELKGASFLWIKDLSEPDKAFMLPFNLPVLGNYVNILPILMALAMLAQQKMSAPKSKAGSDAMQQQQKMMTIFMPVMLGLIFYSLPSGLVLYWFTNTLLMLFHQVRISKSVRLTEAPA